MSHPIENIMQSSMEHVKKLADVNTVIGSPIMSDENTMILPVSKVNLGMLVGGGEYLAVTPVRKSSIEVNVDGNYPFIGASVVGMSLTPLAFLAVQNGTVRVLPAKQECASDRLVDLIPQMIDTAERLIRELACGSSCDKESAESNAGEEACEKRPDTKAGNTKQNYSPYGEFD